MRTSEQLGKLAEDAETRAIMWSENGLGRSGWSVMNSSIATAAHLFMVAEGLRRLQKTQHIKERYGR